MGNITCPKCEFIFDINRKKCPSCKQPLVIENTLEVAKLDPKEKMLQQVYINKSLSSGNLSQENRSLLNNSLGLLALGSKSYQIAQNHFNKALEENPENSESRYYYCLSLLNGIRPYFSKRDLIDQIIQNLDFAFALNMKGKYAYLKALVINDFYTLKSLRHPESVASILDIANMMGVTDEEKLEIYSILNMKQPEGF